MTKSYMMKRLGAMTAPTVSTAITASAVWDVCPVSTVATAVTVWDAKSVVSVVGAKSVLSVWTVSSVVTVAGVSKHSSVCHALMQSYAASVWTVPILTRVSDCQAAPTAPTVRAVLHAPSVPAVMAVASVMDAPTVMTSWADAPMGQKLSPKGTKSNKKQKK